jgi:hypothetical protein
MQLRANGTGLAKAFNSAPVEQVRISPGRA